MYTLIREASIFRPVINRCWSYYENPEIKLKISRLEKENRKLEAKQNALLDKYLTGGISQKLFGGANSKLEEQIQDVNAELDRIKREEKDIGEFEDKL